MKLICLEKAEQEDVRHVSERYIGKSNPYIVMVSTPNPPGGLFEKIEKEPEETCIYRRLLLDYNYGIDKIFTREEIEKVKHSHSFEREYNLKYLGKIGNLLSQLKIDTAIQLGNTLKLRKNTSQSVLHSFIRNRPWIWFIIYWTGTNRALEGRR